MSEQRLSQSEAMQLIKNFTSDHARLEVEYYLGIPQGGAILPEID